MRDRIVQITGIVGSAAAVLAIFLGSMNFMFGGLRDDIRTLRQDMDAGFSEVRAEIRVLRQDMN
ncbi:MAG: hypothetical protein OXH27_00205, partial [Gammaproteobacteria bacterium]|nr:hypothetical protein [Gammaproteobacteria bacterium]